MATQTSAQSELVQAILAQDIVRVTSALAAEIDINARLDDAIDSWTPLEAACHTGNIAIIDLVLKAGADVNQPDDCGMNVLMNCAYAGAADVVNFLIERKVDVTLADENGRSAAGWAWDGGNYKIVRDLLDLGAPNASIPYWFLMAHQAIKHNEDEVFLRQMTEDWRFRGFEADIVRRIGECDDVFLDRYGAMARRCPAFGEAILARRMRDSACAAAPTQARGAKRTGVI